MPRRPAPKYLCPELADLTRQLLFAPADKRATLVGRAEQLHDQLEPDITYPLDFLIYRVTGYRSEIDHDVLLVGAAVQPDLRLMIDALSYSIDLPLDQPDPAETAEGLAARLNVSTKTLSRWRALGLRWRWATVTPPAGRAAKRVVYAGAAVERFLARHGERVQRAANFTPLDPALRERLLERARRLAERRDVSLNRVARHLARRVHRAVQTIRQLLEQHDHRRPEQAIFTDHAGPLTPRQHRVIARARRMGIAVATIAQHYRRSPSTIRRALRDVRAAALRQVRIHYISSPTFTRADADEVLLRPDSAAATDPAAAPPHAVSAVPLHDLPEALRPLYRQPVLDADHQRSLLARMNYLKFKAAAAQVRLDPYEPRGHDLDQIESSLKHAGTLRNRLVGANLPVVLTAARRHLIGVPAAPPRRLIELLEVGNQVLIEAIDGFDFGKDTPFESYLTWHLMRRFAAGAGEAGAPGAPGVPAVPGAPAGPADPAAPPGAGAGAGAGAPGLPGAQAAAGRAYRREDGAAVLHRLIDQAGESGVDLKLEPEEERGA